jgi:hypothetical protein
MRGGDLARNGLAIGDVRDHHARALRRKRK